MRLGTADDNRDADGVDVLSFAQAQRKALADATRKALEATGHYYTVGEAITDYLAHLELQGKPTNDAKIKFDAYVPPMLLQRTVASLTSEDFAKWLESAVKREPRRKPKTKPPPKRTRVSKRLKKASEKTPEPLADGLMRRKSTVNRVISNLKACLNYAYLRNRAPNNDAWQKLQKFRNVSTSRQRWLTEDEAIELQAACRPDFRLLVRAALFTGCREGELLNVRVGDIDHRNGTLLIPKSKSGKPRQVPLTTEGVSFFTGLEAGKRRGEAIFLRHSNAPWHRVAVIRAMQSACAAATIEPPVTFHGLRHTYASHLVREGTPLMYVANALGHGDTRMVETHYGHLASSHVAETIRANLPSFSAVKSKEQESTVVSISKRKVAKS
jgi:hypothetical protein